MSKPMKSGVFGLNYVYDYDKMIKYESKTTIKQKKKITKKDINQGYSKPKIKRLTKK